MKLPLKSLVLAALAALLVSSIAHAEDSLYDREHAAKLSPSVVADFGPRASEFRYDPRMIRAAQIAAQRAKANSTAQCWRYVKDALLSAEIVDSRPTTVYAKQAAGELTSKFGFTKLDVTNPFEAPVGSVLVYGGGGAGHIEFRTAFGFVSDFWSFTPSHRPLIGVFVKKSSES